MDGDAVRISEHRMPCYSLAVFPNEKVRVSSAAVGVESCMVMVDSNEQKVPCK